MKSTFNILTLREIKDFVASGKLNPDPISQRPATSSGHKKSQGIIEALVVGYGVGMIAVRDISNDTEMQKVYPGVKYLVIDGGHRARAVHEYCTNKFKFNNKFFKELSDEEQNEFLSIQIPFEYIVCTSTEAIHIFRTRNKTTDVNFIEMVMCDDESPVCKEVRSRTKFYKEYDNFVHPLFTSFRSDNGERKSECFDTDINPRRKWDEYVFIAIIKALGRGNVDAGQREIESLVSSEYQGNIVPKKAFAVVDRFLDDVRSFRFERGKRLNGDVFAAIQLVWFGLYEKNTEFKINNITKFTNEFMNAYAKLTGTGNVVYNNKIVNVGTEEHQELVNLKEYVRSNIKNFSNNRVQRICAKFFFEEMGEDIGVVFRDTKRSLDTKHREEHLALQRYKCALDGESLKLEDSVWGHDVAWADGGKLFEGKVIRKTHNTDMGKLTLDEYRLILDLRKKNSKQVA